VRTVASFALALALAAVSTLARPCAADLQGPEKAWAKACVDALASPSERVRNGAADALGRLGVDAVPALLTGAAKLTTDVHWAAAERACRAMGAAKAAEALADRSDAWPKAQATRLVGLVDRLRAAKAPAARPDAPAEGDVGARARKILASFEGESSYSSEEPRVRQLVALGRDVAPVLLEEMRRRGSWGPGPGFRATAAADAMAGLATDEDLDALAQLLADGHLIAARSFQRLQGDRVVAALLAPVSKGFVDHDLLEALRRHRKDERVRPALLEWLEEHGASASFEVGHAATFLAEDGAREAVPLLVPLLDGASEPEALVEIAKAVVTLGDPRGIPVLIDVMRRGGSRTGWAEHSAGEALNRVVGETIYAGSAGPGMGVTGNARAAAGRFAEWWEASKDRLRFDDERGAWVVAPPR
jgi:hypothetical protein